MQKSNDQWKQELSPEAFHVLREKGTEAPFSGTYVTYDADGIYTCAGCGTELFSSSRKFDAHCGWPSFDDVASSGAVKTTDDFEFGMHRIEVTCASCGGHLGHIFNDGPQTLPNGASGTGDRYCINSVALNFKPKE